MQAIFFMLQRIPSVELGMTTVRNENMLLYKQAFFPFYNIMYFTLYSTSIKETHYHHCCLFTVFSLLLLCNKVYLKLKRQSENVKPAKWYSLAHIMLCYVADLTRRRWSSSSISFLSKSSGHVSFLFFNIWVNICVCMYLYMQRFIL